MTDVRSLAAAVRDAKDQMELAQQAYRDVCHSAAYILVREHASVVEAYLARNPSAVHGIVRMIDY